MKYKDKEIDLIKTLFILIWVYIIIGFINFGALLYFGNLLSESSNWKEICAYLFFILLIITKSMYFFEYRKFFIYKENEEEIENE